MMAHVCRCLVVSYQAQVAAVTLKDIDELENVGALQLSHDLDLPQCCDMDPLHRRPLIHIGSARCPWACDGRTRACGCTVINRNSARSQWLECV